LDTTHTAKPFKEKKWKYDLTTVLNSSTVI